jgi:hypothetical protein
MNLPNSSEPAFLAIDGAPSGEQATGRGPAASAGSTIAKVHCACGMPRFPTADGPALFSRAWHVEHRLQHCEAFPELDEGSRRNLDNNIRWASL